MVGHTVQEVQDVRFQHHRVENHRAPTQEGQAEVREHASRRSVTDAKGQHRLHPGRPRRFRVEAQFQAHDDIHRLRRSPSRGRALREFSAGAI